MRKEEIRMNNLLSRNEENEFQLIPTDEKKEQTNRGLQLLQKAVEITTRQKSIIRDTIYSSVEFSNFVSRIERGQKLVLDIPQEIMEKIQSGEYSVMKTKDGGILKAEILDSNGKIKQHMDVKWEDFCNIPNPAELINMAQMKNIQGQLQEVVKQLEFIAKAVQNVLIGQQNDRIALYRSGEQLFVEAMATRNKELQEQLLVSALKTLEDARMQMIENIKTEIAAITAYDHSQNILKFMEFQDIQERIERVNASFDVINQTSILKAGIYCNQGETEAMLCSLKQYSDFLSTQIIPNAQMLYMYDSGDLQIEGGKWFERSQAIPQKVDALMDACNIEHQILEIDYELLKELGATNYE